MEVHKLSSVNFNFGGWSGLIATDGHNIVHCTLYIDCVGSCDYVIAVYGAAALAALCWVCGIAAGRTHVLCIGVLN